MPTGHVAVEATTPYGKAEILLPGRGMYFVTDGNSVVKVIYLRLIWKGADFYEADFLF